jgi:hypothetical protein
MVDPLSGWSAAAWPGKPTNNTWRRSNGPNAAQLALLSTVGDAGRAITTAAFTGLKSITQHTIGLGARTLNATSSPSARNVTTQSPSRSEDGDTKAARWLPLLFRS